MSEQWYYVLGSETRGPHSRSELQGLAQAGKIQSATLIWREGMEDWTTAATLLPKGPSVTPPPIPPPPISSAKWMPPPPARLTVPPPRPTGRPGSAASQNSLLAAVGGVALIAGLGIGWLAHAMLMQPGNQVPVTVARAPSQTASQGSKPAVRSAEIAKSTAPAAAASPVVTREASLAQPAANSPPVSSPPLPANPTPAVVSSPTREPPAATAPSPPVSPTPDTPSNPPPPPAKSSTSPPSRAQAAPPLYQEIDVQRAPKFAILGVVTAQEVRYQLLSELRVGEPDAEGIRTVAQTVVDTKLVAADALSRPMFEASLKNIKGWQFSYTLSKDGEVLKMLAGPADAPKVAKVEPMGGKGFIVTSVMDEAGWKELAQLSFYVPDAQASGNKRQLRQMTHDFGPLGSFSGETSFVRKGTQQGILRIDYAHALVYRGPGKDLAGALPGMTIKGAELRPDIAGGNIGFDVKAKRVRQAEDHFRVKGEIAVDIAGMEVGLQIEEEQAIAVRIVDQNPWSK